MNQKYDGYFITSCGRVWSYRSKKFLSSNYDKDGYLEVRLFKEGKKKHFYIHRLVAQTYIPNPNDYETVDHIDGNKEHNYINNLQWMTREDNVRKGVSKKVQCIETGEIFNSVTEAANSVNRNIATLINCLKGRSKTCGGLHWEYI